MLEEASEAGVSYLVSSALSPEEYRWHQKLSDKAILKAMGIHPIYKQEEQDFNLLSELASASEINAIGEIGLDKAGGLPEEQESLLLKQLDLARAFNLPVIFHVVKRYNELYKLLKNNFPKVRGYLHSFNSSMAVAEHFSQFNLAFSISSRLPDSKTIQYIVKRGFMLLETDAPFALNRDIDAEFNKPAFLLNNLEDMIEKSGIAKQIIIDAQSDSFREIFDIKDVDEE